MVCQPVSYTHLRAHETGRNLVCRLLLVLKKRQPPRSTLDRSSAASDVYKRQEEGLVAYNPVTNHSRFFRRENGLSTERTNNIMVDSLNRIWIGTSNGLCMLNEKRDKIKRFDVHDGLPTNQFNEQAAFRTHDGLFIYPTYKGFLTFKPEAYTEKNSAISLYITSFKISDKEID